MGQRGWHSRGYLPHVDADGVVQHVVFRLHDSMPDLNEGSGDDILDLGLGSAWLRDHHLARIVSEALLHFDGRRYALHAWCVMPNHVHVLVYIGAAHELGAIVQAWKSYTARQINMHLGRKGRVWAADYFDRYMRDERHYETSKAYIEMNPVKAALCESPADWAFGSAGWRG